MKTWTVDPGLKAKLGSFAYEALKNIADHLRKCRKLFNKIEDGDPGWMSFPDQSTALVGWEDPGLMRRLSSSVSFLRKNGHLKVYKVCAKGNLNGANRYELPLRVLKSVSTAFSKIKSEWFKDIPSLAPSTVPVPSFSDCSVSTPSLSDMFSALQDLAPGQTA